MKFTAELDAKSLPRFKGQYLDYRALKKAIKSICVRVQESVSSASDVRVGRERLSLAQSTAAAQLFAVELQKELVRIDSFVSAIQGRMTEDRAAVLRARNSGIVDAREVVQKEQDLWHQSAELRDFAELNYIAVYKITKKLDKSAGCHSLDTVLWVLEQIPFMKLLDPSNTKSASGGRGSIPELFERARTTTPHSDTDEELKRVPPGVIGAALGAPLASQATSADSARTILPTADGKSSSSSNILPMNGSGNAVRAIRNESSSSLSGANFSAKEAAPAQQLASNDGAFHFDTLTASSIANMLHATLRETQVPASTPVASSGAAVNETVMHLGSAEGGEARFAATLAQRIQNSGDSGLRSSRGKLSDVFPFSSKVDTAISSSTSQPTEARASPSKSETQTQPFPDSRTVRSALSLFHQGLRRTYAVAGAALETVSPELAYSEAEKNKRLTRFNVFLMKSQAIVAKQAKTHISLKQLDEEIIAAKLELFRLLLSVIVKEMDLTFPEGAAAVEHCLTAYHELFGQYMPLAASHKPGGRRISLMEGMRPQAAGHQRAKIDAPILGAAGAPQQSPTRRRSAGISSSPSRPATRLEFPPRQAPSIISGAMPTTHADKGGSTFNADVVAPMKKALSFLGHFPRRQSIPSACALSVTSKSPAGGAVVAGLSDQERGLLHIRIADTGKYHGRAAFESGAVSAPVDLIDTSAVTGILDLPTRSSLDESDLPPRSAPAKPHQVPSSDFLIGDLSVAAAPGDEHDNAIRDARITVRSDTADVAISSYWRNSAGTHGMLLAGKLSGRGYDETPLRPLDESHAAASNIMHERESIDFPSNNGREHSPHASARPVVPASSSSSSSAASNSLLSMVHVSPSLGTHASMVRMQRALSDGDLAGSESWARFSDVTEGAAISAADRNDFLQDIDIGDSFPPLASSFPSTSGWGQPGNLKTAQGSTGARTSSTILTTAVSIPASGATTSDEPFSARVRVCAFKYSRAAAAGLVLVLRAASADVVASAPKWRHYAAVAIGIEDEDDVPSSSIGTSPENAYIEADAAVFRMQRARKGPAKTVARRLYERWRPAAVEWLPDYKWRKYLARDVVSGVTIGVLLIPQGLAYAVLAGLPPVYGVYTGLPAIVYALFGTSRHAAVGPMSLPALLMATAVSDLSPAPANPAEYAGNIMALTLECGLVLFLLGWLNMGWVVRFISQPVLSGFISAAAVMTILSTAKDLLGAPYLPRSQVFQDYAVGIVNALPSTHAATFTTGLIAILLLQFLPKVKQLEKIPASLLVVAATIIVFSIWMAATGDSGTISSATGMPGANATFGASQQPAGNSTGASGTAAIAVTYATSVGISLVGHVPSSFPIPTMPPLNRFLELLPAAVSVTFVGFIESIAVAKMYGMKYNYEISPSSELKALGMTNMVGAVVAQSFLVMGAFSRSSVNDASGARSQLSGVVSALVVAAMLLFVMPVLFYLPKCVLAALIVMGVSKLINPQSFSSLWRIDKRDLLCALAAFVATLFLGVLIGIVSSMAFSLVIFVAYTTQPQVQELGRLAGTVVYRELGQVDVTRVPDVKIIRFVAPLFFANCSVLKDRLLLELVRRKQLPPRLQWRALLLDFQAIATIDSTSVQVLEEVLVETRQQRTPVLVAGANTAVEALLAAAGVVDKLGGRRFLFRRVHEAVRAVILREVQAQDLPTPLPAGKSAALLSTAPDEQPAARGGGRLCSGLGAAASSAAAHAASGGRCDSSSSSAAAAVLTPPASADGAPYPHPLHMAWAHRILQTLQAARGGAVSSTPVPVAASSSLSAAPAPAPKVSAAMPGVGENTRSGTCAVWAPTAPRPPSALVSLACADSAPALCEDDAETESEAQLRLRARLELGGNRGGTAGSLCPEVAQLNAAVVAAGASTSFGPHPHIISVRNLVASEHTE